MRATAAVFPELHAQLRVEEVEVDEPRPGEVLVRIRQAVDSVGMRGTCALIGGAPAGAQFQLDHLTTPWGKRVVGILGGEGRSEPLIGALIDLHRQGRFPFDRLVTRFPLEQINEAFAASHSGEVVKPVVTMPR